MAVVLCGFIAWLLWPKAAALDRQGWGAPSAEMPQAPDASGGQPGIGSALEGLAEKLPPGAESLPYELETRECDEPLELAASELLEAYRAQRGCALVQSGYLDLAGNAWSCVVSGDGWVDVCVLARAGDDQERSEVCVMRMEVDEWSEQWDEG